MIKRTIGPWEIVGTTTITNSEHSMTVANVSSWSLTPEQVQEHAQLIASAPNLYEVLVSLLEEIDKRSGGRLEGTSDFAKTAESARALVAKINGN